MNEREILLQLLTAMQSAYSVASTGAQNTETYDEALFRAIELVEEWKEQQVRMMNKSLLRDDARMAEAYRLSSFAANRVLEFLRGRKS